MRDLQRLFRVLPPRLRWRWIALLPGVLLSAGLEAIGAAAVFGLLRVLNNPAVALQLPVARSVPWLNDTSSSEAIILWFTAGVVALYLFRFLCLAVMKAVGEHVTFESIATLADSLLDRYLEGPFAAVTTRGTGEMSHRLSNAEMAVLWGLGSSLQVLAEVLVIIGFVALLSLAAPLATIFAVVATAVLLLLPVAFFKRLFSNWGQREEVYAELVKVRVLQGLGALREIKVYGREHFFRSSVALAQDWRFRLRRRRIVANDVLRLGVETVFVVVLLAVVAVRAWRSPDVDLVSLLGLYAFAGFRLVPSVNRITLHMGYISAGTPAAAAICDDLAALKADQGRLSGTEPSLNFTSELRLDDVTYHYQGGVQPALESVDLSIRRGETVALVGPSGAGKSTVADLVLGLIDPTAGRVTVDGVDIRAARRNWQRHIGYVAQSFYLLDDTLRSNIAFGLPADAVDKARVDEVIKIARLEPVVAALPQGLDTLIGERGARLSGGERQRVAIARALYGRPAVLVLDEATASLDPVTEREITDAIETLHGSMTIIVIAHRMSTVKACDRIVMFLDGHVETTGTFDQLMATSDAFRRLATGDLQPPAAAVPGA